ncbi:hypothetical protein [Ktedonobacter racemifer]|nr:hypothetical protein [Ktedonobacter racemifer]
MPLVDASMTVDKAPSLAEGGLIEYCSDYQTRETYSLRDINTIRQFRHDIYDCFLRAKDALFNTVDAFMAETQANSFPERSQSLWFERKWPSLYEAFADGLIDEKRLREIFTSYLVGSNPGERLWIGIDASNIARPEAVTLADRTAQHVHNLPECKKPITFGWQFSTFRKKYM